MSFKVHVFVSSTCYELRDLRAGLCKWLTDLGMVAVMSDEGGFPHDDIQPYVTCLDQLEECLLVIGVIDRKYGTKFPDWGKHSEYNGLSPTHAELRHAIKLRKKILLYVHKDTLNFYEWWRKNKSFENPPHALQKETLVLIEELKHLDPAPWIEGFKDAVDLQNSLNKEFVNQIYRALRDREKETQDLASFVLDKLTEAAPEVREAISNGLNPDLLSRESQLKQELLQIEKELFDLRGHNQQQLHQLENEKIDIQNKLNVVTTQLERTGLLLARSLLKDVAWIDFVRRTMAPAQPCRLPVHNSMEVALRGFKAGGDNKTPHLQQVTWSQLPYRENG